MNALLCVTLAAVLVTSTASAGEQRVALVIGNGAYQHAPLRNPPNDARAMAAALRQCGFSVTEKIDCDQSTMEYAIGDFGREIQGGGVGLFYYSGHGMRVGRTNFLIPVEADVRADDEVAYEAVDVGRILGRMGTAGNRVNIVILDACRDNPFSRIYKSAARGLRKMSVPSGTLLAYAAAPGAVAADRMGRNSLYTSSLLKHLRTPGLTVEQVFKRVRDDVVRESGDSQVPWESTSLQGDFCFVPGSAEQRAEVNPPPQPIMPPPAAVQFGHLQVNVNAPNSQVSIDGTIRGTASPGRPLNLQNLGRGQVRIRVTAAGYEAGAQKATLKAGEWTQVVLELAPVAVPAPVPPASAHP